MENQPKPYGPNEVLIRKDAPEVLYAGDMHPSKRAQMERAKQTAPETTPAPNSEPQAVGLPNEQEVHVALDAYAEKAEDDRAEVHKTGLADIAQNPKESEHQTPDAA